MADQFRLDQFGLFCQRKKGVMGPDIHMKTAGAGTADAGDLRPWRLAVYNNFCSSPSGAVIYGNWKSPDEVLAANKRGFFGEWIRTNWKGIPIRQNRRPARSVPKLTKSLVTLAEWMTSPDGFSRLPELSYDEAWDALDPVYTWGRYVKIKFLETCRRYLGPEYEHLEAPCIEAAGGWSPRRALGIIWPEYESVIANKSRNDKRTLAHVYDVADETKAYVTENYVEVSNYEIEALLCNYKQTLSTRKAFYCGRTIDSELAYHRKITDFWGEDPYRGTFDFFETRRQVFPSQTLGEANGWDDVRLDISPLLRENNIVWSDTVFDYNASKDDLTHPVRWEDHA